MEVTTMAVVSVLHFWLAHVNHPRIRRPECNIGISVEMRNRLPCQRRRCPVGIQNIRHCG